MIMFLAIIGAASILDVLIPLTWALVVAVFDR